MDESYGNLWMRCPKRRTDQYALNSHFSQFPATDAISPAWRGFRTMRHECLNLHEAFRYGT